MAIIWGSILLFGYKGGYDSVCGPHLWAGASHSKISVTQVVRRTLLPQEVGSTPAPRSGNAGGFPGPPLPLSLSLSLNFSIP